MPNGQNADVDELLSELRDWLSANWDPESTLGEWWERLGLAGWSSPNLPVGAYGKGVSRSDGVAVAKEIAAFGAVGAPSGLGSLLAAPTIATHGTQEQIDLFVRDIVTGEKAWCQLFSEPGAGSDLAGLTTRAERDGEEWIVNGQKVWTSGGQYAQMGMLIARTDPDAPKHKGITWFAIEMDQPGVEIRPLVEMTGHAMFNEVFLSDARVMHDAVIGDVHDGWAATNTTLANERAGLGTGGGSVGSGQTAGRGLDQRVGDLAPKQKTTAKKRTGPRPPRGTALDGVAQATGANTDPTVRQDLVRLHIMDRLGQMNAQRLKAARAAGKDIPGMANISKLAMSDMVRLRRDLGLRLLGPAGTLHAYTSEQQESLNAATGNSMAAAITGMALRAQAPSIYGGTDQIQRNIIGERVLGLPKEPGDLATTPFSQLPKNA
ncbi:MAG: acyl-CoA dehydrogenase [Gemmatimonadetes bacterium]|nr:acyl-CoA dehydrogenase [Gemmatimonadota bacterium]